MRDPARRLMSAKPTTRTHTYTRTYTRAHTCTYTCTLPVQNVPRGILDIVVVKSRHHGCTGIHGFISDGGYYRRLPPGLAGQRLGSHVTAQGIWNSYACRDGLPSSVSQRRKQTPRYEQGSWQSSGKPRPPDLPPYSDSKLIGAVNPTEQGLCPGLIQHLTLKTISS